MKRADILIIGAGAAGLMAAIHAGRNSAGKRVVALDGARNLGAKMLMSGGGRCNVTHDRVDATAFAGSSRHSIQKVLRQFDVAKTIEFFRDIGVDLEREETGKLFPATNRARTVLDALLRATAGAGAAILHPRRVDSVARTPDGFSVRGSWGRIDATRVVLATGGRSVPKTGSDGHGYEIARSLGHTTTRIFPALVPLTLPKRHFLTSLAGVSAEAGLEVVSTLRTRIASFTGSTLCTHFGLSGPPVLDISRYYIEAAAEDPRAGVIVNWLPDRTPVAFERELASLGNTRVLRRLEHLLPDRLAAALCAAAGVDGSLPGHQLRRDQRKALAATVTRMLLPVTGHRGFDHAEATAGGVSLEEIRVETMESRCCPGLYLCGEICDVDGRIGGFNFQWAWSSGHAAGRAAAQAARR